MLKFDDRPLLPDEPPPRQPPPPVIIEDDDDGIRPLDRGVVAVWVGILIALSAAWLALAIGLVALFR